MAFLLHSLLWTKNPVSLILHFVLILQQYDLTLKLTLLEARGWTEPTWVILHLYNAAGEASLWSQTAPLSQDCSLSRWCKERESAWLQTAWKLKPHNGTVENLPLPKSQFFTLKPLQCQNILFFTFCCVGSSSYDDPPSLRSVGNEDMSPLQAQWDDSHSSTSTCLNAPLS